MDNSENILQQIRSRLAGLRIQWKFLKAASGLLHALTALILGLVLLTAIESIAWMSPPLKAALLSVLALVVLVFLGKSLFSLFSIFLYPQQPPDSMVAQWVGDKILSIRDQLRNAVQLQSDDSIGKNRMSEVLRKQAMLDIAPEFLELDLKPVLNKRMVYVGLRTLAISVPLLLLLLIPSFKAGAFRIVHPLQKFVKPLPFGIVMQPGDVTVIEGDTLTITANTSAGYPAELEFTFSYPNGNDAYSEKHIVPLNQDSSYIHTVNAIAKPFTYKANSGRVASESFAVQVLIPPAINSFYLRLNPPAYSKFPPLILDDNIGDALVLAGTQVDFELSAKSELSEAYLCWKGESGIDTVAFNLNANEAYGSLQVREPGTYHFRLQDQQEILNRYPIDYEFDIILDLSPLVEIVQPGVDLELSGIIGLKLLVEAEDDFGIGKMQLFYKRTSSFEVDSTADFQNTLMKFQKYADDIFRAEYLWDLEDLDLIPGDIVEYYARVCDNDNVMGPKYSNSNIFILRLPTMVEMFNALEQDETEGLKQLEKTLEKSKEIHEEIEKAINEIRKKGDLEWTEKRNLEDKVKQQKETLEKLDKAKEAVEDIMKRAEESSLMSLELLEKYNELQKLMAEVADPELLKAMQRMQDALQQADPEQLRQAAEMFQMSQEEMLERVKKSLEILKQLKMERQLEELAQRALEMAERQDEIADSLNNRDPNNTTDLQRREEMLKRDMEDFQETLEKAKDLAAELDSLTAGELEDISKEASEVPDEMMEMKESMQQGKTKPAQQQGRQISQKLSQMSQKLTQSKESMVSRKKEELSKFMLQAVRDLVSLSQLQEALKEESSTLSVQSPRYRDQASIQSGMREGLEKVTNDLFELSQQTFFITPQIGQALGQSASMMDAALANYTNRSPRDVSNQQTRAVEAINRAAVQILDAMDKMQGSSSSTGFNELMEQLQKMAGQQGGLNQETQSMMMPMPGEGAGMSMEQMSQMGRLAAEQRALQKAMQDAAQQAEELGGVLGDLGQVGEQMGEAADSLEDRNVGERTLKLQERILSRLLDAQKSVRTQRVSKERQSRRGENVVRRSPDEIPEDILEEMLRRDIMQAMKEGYSPDYQKLIRDYYKALYEKKRN